MTRNYVWPLICCGVVGFVNLAEGQLRVFRGGSQAAQQQAANPGPFNRRQPVADDQPQTFQGPMPPAPKAPAIRVPAGTRPAEDTKELVDQAISLASQRPIDVRVIPPWAISHSVLALRNDLVLVDQGRQVNGIEWMSNQARFWQASDPKNRGSYWFEATQYGARAQPFNGTPFEFEGHANQTLALLAMSNLPLDHQFTVANGRKVTMADMVRHAQMTANSEEEITWTLWFLTQYLDPDTQWTNAKGERWSMENLVRLQTQAEVTTAPCGGTHGLFALAYVRNSYLRKHGELRGIWLSADMKVQQYVEAAKALQNADGSFSTMFFKGRGESRDLDERMKSSGHMLEWLMMALPQSRLQEDWVQRGIRSLARDVVLSSSQPANCGYIYHSLNALSMYRQRMSGSTPAKPKLQPDVAAVPETPKPIQTAEVPMEMRPPVVSRGDLPVVTAPMEPISPLAAIEEPKSPIERPVPAIPQPMIEEAPVIASAKPSIDAPPSAPSTGMPPLIEPYVVNPPAVVGTTPVTPTPNVQPPRVALLPSEDAPQPRLLIPVPSAPHLTEMPRIAPSEPSGSVAPTAPKAIRVVPGAVLESMTEPSSVKVEETPVPRTNRLFVPLKPEKLFDEKKAVPNVLPEDAKATTEAAPEDSAEVTQMSAEEAGGPALPAPRE